MKKYCLDGEIADFDFHDQSGFWSYCGPKSLKAFLADLKTGEKAEIEINSPGGSVVYGCEMANAIKNSDAHLIAHVTGMAASMASVIACACDEIVLDEASFMMIHDPWTELAGNAADLRKEADLLDQMKSMILSFYRGKFEKSEEELAALMSETTYMTANECVENGLKCRVVKSDVRYAAKLTSRDMAKAPEAARAFFNTAEMPEDVKAAIEAARATQIAEPSAVTPTATSPVDWEARYKGASKKLNEYQAKITELEKKIADAALESVDYGKIVAERDGLKNQVAALEETAAKAVETEKNLKDQLEKTGKDLADAKASISDLTAKLEKSETDLAQTNQQLDHLKKTRDLLTAGVLTPSDGESSYAAQMAKATTPEERENLRAQKRAGKIK